MLASLLQRAAPAAEEAPDFKHLLEDLVRVVSMQRDSLSDAVQSRTVSEAALVRLRPLVCQRRCLARSPLRISQANLRQEHKELKEDHARVCREKDALLATASAPCTRCAERAEHAPVAASPVQAPEARAEGGEALLARRELEWSERYAALRARCIALSAEARSSAAAARRATESAANFQKMCATYEQTIASLLGHSVQPCTPPGGSNPTPAAEPPGAPDTSGSSSGSDCSPPRDIPAEPALNVEPSTQSGHVGQESGKDFPPSASAVTAFHPSPVDVECFSAHHPTRQGAAPTAGTGRRPPRHEDFTPAPGQQGKGLGPWDAPHADDVSASDSDSGSGSEEASSDEDGSASPLEDFTSSSDSEGSMGESPPPATLGGERSHVPPLEKRLSGAPRESLSPKQPSRDSSPRSSSSLAREYLGAAATDDWFGPGVQQAVGEGWAASPRQSARRVRGAGGMAGSPSPHTSATPSPQSTPDTHDLRCAVAEGEQEVVSDDEFAYEREALGEYSAYRAQEASKHAEQQGVSEEGVLEVGEGGSDHSGELELSFHAASSTSSLAASDAGTPPPTWRVLSDRDRQYSPLQIDMPSSETGDAVGRRATAGEPRKLEIQAEKPGRVQHRATEGRQREGGTTVYSTRQGHFEQRALRIPSVVTLVGSVEDMALQRARQPGTHSR